MYKRVETDKEFTTRTGVRVTPLITLADHYGGRVQIAEDDHNYVIYLVREGNVYEPTPWIFHEAFEALKTLPPLK